MKKVNYEAPKMERMEMECESPIAVSIPQGGGSLGPGTFNP